MQYEITTKKQKKKFETLKKDNNKNRALFKKLVLKVAHQKKENCNNKKKSIFIHKHTHTLLHNYIPTSI